MIGFETGSARVHGSRPVCGEYGSTEASGMAVAIVGDKAARRTPHSRRLLSYARGLQEFRS